MRQLTKLATVVRRMIIVLAGIMLVMWAVDRYWPDKGIKEYIRLLEKDGPVTHYDVDRSFKIDGDTIIVKTMYITPTQVVIHYKDIKGDVGGWSLSNNALKLFDSKGKELMQRSSSAHSSPWGDEGFLHYEGLGNTINSSLTIRFELFDRNFELALPLGKEDDRR
ncbi:hypothetical protein D7Z26_00460 [Cohnella endophytica]|uniref:DUF5643 domain-containing protein n=1 Tax=Cohnella endophytica TaxID=2419778 RepID=A0A494Y5Q8_9BACL|nr:DUF5643 domain-containing protein [Cohnella endophytica]RKP58019.1 hypothetical protein D7Z26_00460 [Cohnella endophytica]